MQHQINDCNNGSNEEKTTNRTEEIVSNIIIFIVKSGFKITEEELKEKLRPVLNELITDTSNLREIARLIINRTIPYQDNMHNKITPDTAKKVVIELLLERGLNPNLKDSNGYTFIETALMEILKVGEIQVNNADFGINLKEALKVLTKFINNTTKFGYDVNDEKIGISAIITRILEIANSNSFDKSIPAAILDTIFNILKENNLEFDFTKYGNDIITLLDAYINSLEPQFKESEQDLINELKLKLQEIKIYIKLRCHPSFVNPATKEETSKVLEQLYKLIEFKTKTGIYESGFNYLLKAEHNPYGTFNNLDILTWLDTEYNNTNIDEVYQEAKEKIEDIVIWRFEGLEFTLVPNAPTMAFVLHEITPSIYNFVEMGKEANIPYPVNGSHYARINWLRKVDEELSRKYYARLSEQIETPFTPLNQTTTLVTSRSPIIDIHKPKKKEQQP